jgi:hypothetical protein
VMRADVAKPSGPWAGQMECGPAYANLADGVAFHMSSGIRLQLICDKRRTGQGKGQLLPEWPLLTSVRYEKSFAPILTRAAQTNWTSSVQVLLPIRGAGR